MPRLGLIAGLKTEIEAIEGAFSPRSQFFAAGGGSDRAADAARRMAKDGAELLISIGLAGGLDPALRTGDVVIASTLVTPGEIPYRAETAPEWREKLADAIRGDMRCVIAPIVGSDTAIVSAQGKAELFRATQAVAVDMESHGVARAATELGLPFLALRVIADEAHRAVPWSAMAGMAPDGAVRPAAVIFRLLLRLWEVPALIRLARDSKQAHAALGRVALRSAAVLR